MRQLKRNMSINKDKPEITNASPLMQSMVSSLAAESASVAQVKSNSGKGRIVPSHLLTPPHAHTYHCKLQVIGLIQVQRVTLP
jgi:hypothetical protein